MRVLALLLSVALAACDGGEVPTVVPDPGPPGIVYPLSAPAGSRFLRDSLDRPVRLHGDAAWSLVANLSLAEAEAYLDDRAARGVNAIYVNLVETAFSDQDPPWLTVAGDAPFDPLPDTYILDFSAPREAYWQHVDAVLEAAAARDILVIAFPAYMGWQQQFDGWSYALDANGVDRMRAYGAFLGDRYASQPNLIWAAGGDWRADGPTYALVDEVTAYVEAVRARDDVHLWTAHGGQESGTEAYGYLGLDLETTYRYPPEQVPDAVRTDLDRSPRLPVLFFEGWYENEYDVSRAQLRYQAYTSLLMGAMGQVYGNHPVWKFGEDWEDALDDPGARDQVRLDALFRARPLDRLVPDAGPDIVTSDRGDLLDGTYVAVARSAESAVIYVPDERTITVDLGQAVEAETAQLWCLDPATGAATDLGTRAAEGRVAVEACGAPDWVLVVDDAAFSLGAPVDSR